MLDWQYIADYPISGALGFNFPFLSEISPRDSIFNRRKRQAFEIASSLKLFNPIAASQLYSCCSFLQFRYDESLKIKLFRANFCRSRICPLCMARKSDVWAAKAFQNLPRLKKDFPNSRFLFLTLTVKNCEIFDLRNTINNINKAWSKLTDNSRCNWSNWKWLAVGFIKTVEVTRGNNGTAHPHLHALLMVNENYFKKHNYVQHYRWREVWQKALMVEYEPFVNIKAVPIESENRSILEILKYEIKISDLSASPRFTSQYLKECKGLRFLSSGGLLRKYFKFSDGEEDLLHGLTRQEHYYQSQNPDLSFYWNEKINQYTIEEF